MNMLPLCLRNTGLHAPAGLPPHNSSASGYGSESPLPSGSDHLQAGYVLPEGHESPPLRHLMREAVRQESLYISCNTVCSSAADYGRRPGRTASACRNGASPSGPESHPLYICNYFYFNLISPILINSKIAWLLPLTPNFCMTLDIWFLTVFSLM